MDLQTKNPIHQPLLKVHDPEKGMVGIGCTRHRPYVVELLAPEHCAKCEGANAFVEFCPVCRDDCECE